jgi:hypothetical protein
MAKQLVSDTPTSDSPDPIYVPQDLIDGVTVASLRWSIDPLARRARWLYNKVVGGVDRIRTVNSTAAMKAISIPLTGDLCAVIGEGLFRYNTQAWVGAEGPMIYAGTSAGGGRWTSVSKTGAGLAYGLATLDSNGKLVERTRYPTIVDYGTGSLSSVSGLNANAEIGNWSFATVAGDYVCIDVVGVFDSFYVADVSARLQAEKSTDGGSTWSHMETVYSLPVLIFESPTNPVTRCVQSANIKISGQSSGSSLRFRLLVMASAGHGASFSEAVYSYTQVRL